MSKRLHLHGCSLGTTLKQALVEHKKYGRKFVGGERKEKNRRGKFWLRGIEKLRERGGEHGHEFTVLPKMITKACKRCRRAMATKKCRTAPFLRGKNEHNT